MAIYVVGDIQGCYKPLRKLLRSADFSPARDRLWCVGDLVNRGPRSLDTLRYLHELGDAVRIVLGNHDLHFLALHHGCASVNSRHTMGKLLKAPDCETLAQWLRQQPLLYDETVDTEHGDQHFVMVHAGIPPQWSLEQAHSRAAEVSVALQGKHFTRFLRKMYGNTPARWDDSLSGSKRLRVITNYLTRMRFCTADGRLDLTAKAGRETAPAGYRPWFEYEQVTPACHIVFGHWAALEGHTGHPYVHALDTGCSWGRQLTMMRLQDQRLFSVDP